MDRIATIAAELATDPLARDYASMTNAEAAASMNVQDRSAPVGAYDVRRYLHLARKMGGIIDAKASGGGQGTRAAANEFVDALDSFVDFDLTDPTVSAVVVAVLDGLITEGFIDTTNKATILAMGDNRRTRGEELGLRVVYESDIMDVRG